MGALPQPAPLPSYFEKRLHISARRVLGDHQLVAATPHRLQPLPILHYLLHRRHQPVNVVPPEHVPVLPRTYVALRPVPVAADDRKRMCHRL